MFARVLALSSATIVGVSSHSVALEIDARIVFGSPIVGSEEEVERATREHLLDQALGLQSELAAVAGLEMQGTLAILRVQLERSSDDEAGGGEGQSTAPPASPGNASAAPGESGGGEHDPAAPAPRSAAPEAIALVLVPVLSGCVFCCIFPCLLRASLSGRQPGEPPGCWNAEAAGEPGVQIGDKRLSCDDEVPASRHAGAPCSPAGATAAVHALDESARPRAAQCPPADAAARRIEAMPLRVVVHGRSMPDTSAQPSVQGDARAAPPKGAAPATHAQPQDEALFAVLLRKLMPVALLAAAGTGERRAATWGHLPTSFVQRQVSPPPPPPPPQPYTPLVLEEGAAVRTLARADSAGTRVARQAAR